MPFFDPIRLGSAAAAADSDYTVSRSFRFNDNSNTHLSRTPSGAGNRKVWTYSVWVKRGNIGLSSNATMFHAYDGSSSNRGVISFNTSDQLNLNQGGGSGSAKGQAVTTAKFRDPSAWYHIVVRANYSDSTASDRIKVYVNGIQQTLTFNVAYTDENGQINGAFEHEIGAVGSTGSVFDGYMAEINFVDGQAYDPSYFGQTNATTGQWNPKEYTGSYGSNGFYLDFSDNSSITNMCLDRSGNGNNFSPDNTNTEDSMLDTPTNNFATMSPLAVSGDGNHPTFTEGNLKTMGPDSGIGKVGATFGLSSGKWYVEALITQGGSNLQIGIIFSGTNYANNEYLGSGSDYAIAADTYNKKIRKEGSDNQTSLGGMQNGDILAFAIDMDNGTFQLYNNGSTKGSQVSFTVANYAPVTFGQTSGYNTVGTHWNFGADSTFAGSKTRQGNADANGQGDFYYSPPSGFLAVCSANLPDPTIKLPNKHFGTILYTGNGSSRSVTDTSAVNFTPSWSWFKARGGSIAGLMYDAVRGSTKYLQVNSNNPEGTGSDSQTGFVSGGFSLGADTSTTGVNQNTNTYVAWNWNGGDSDSKTYKVKVVADSTDYGHGTGSNKYQFFKSDGTTGFGTNGVDLDLEEGGTYIFDWSDSSAQNHPIRFSLTNDGTHSSGTSAGTEYTTGVTKDDSAYKTTITIASGVANLFYYCQNHSGMGAEINTNTTKGSTNFDGSIKTTVKLNATAGFSIVSYEGNGTDGATIGHGLGVTPNHVIWKNRDASVNWINWQTQLADTCVLLNLNAEAISASGNGLFTYGDFNSTQLKLKTGGNTNGNNQSMIAYCFSEVAGYSRFGKYTGNGQSDGAFVFTGFRPAWLMVKRFDVINNWPMVDSARNTFNPVNSAVYADLGTSESTATRYDFCANGFKTRSTFNESNGNGASYIYLAFAESPFKYARAR